MATAEKRVVTDATGQAMLAELRKIPGVMNPVPIEKGGTGVTTPEEILEVIGAQPKFDFDVEEQLNAAVKSVNEIKPDAHGNVQILRVPMADNFTSDEAQVVSGAFIERTTGGDASINDGIATLGVLYGNSIRSGYSAESTNMEVQLVGRIDDSIPLSATIDWDVYKAAVNYISTNKTFTYTTSWSENPGNYGITLSGTPVSGDVINVYFIAENRGSIVNATPETFVQTNWNLYDHSVGYARVLKYSDEHGFKIGGQYTALSFAATVEGEKTVITPDSDGLFDVPSDGYVFVTGGNDSGTYILMTWSDWSNGYTGDFLTFAEDTIDFSELMQNAFPFGMCAIGITMDEINFNDKTAIVRIERVAYTTENRILAEQSGRAFVYDADWIYSVKETPDRIRFNIDNQVTVYDHGMEYFTGTEVPVLAYELFGQNLKAKLRREVVAVTPQSFSSAQKAQARQNIEAAWNSEVIKSINNKVPDANGNITIVEGQSNASYGSYRIDPVIPPAAWTLVNGQYQVAYFDPLIKATMTGAETWLDDNDVMLGATHFSTADGSLMIVTEVLPTETWRLHVLLAENGATVLEQVHNKAEESTIAIVETDDTAFHNITAGQYVMWKGEIFKATAAIASGAVLSATGNNANLSSVTGGVGNDLNNNLQITQHLIPASVTSTINSVATLNAALENSSMNTLAIDSSYRATLASAGLIPVSSAGTWEVRKLSSNYMFMEYTTYGGHKYIANINNGVLSSWNEMTDFVGIEIAANTDLNTLTTPGNYHSLNASRSSTLLNTPLTDVGFTLTVMKKGSYCQQVLTSNTKIFVRGSGSSGFEDWAEKADRSVVNALSDQIADINTGLTPVSWITNANANDYITTGTYLLSTGGTNLPSSGMTYVVLNVIAQKSKSIVVQTISHNNRLYHREFRSSSWSDWHKLAIVNDFGIQYGYISSSSPIVLTLGNNYRGIAYSVGSNGYMGVWLLNVSSTGVVAIFALGTQSHVTCSSVSGTTNKVQFVNDNSGASPSLFIGTFVGSVTGQE